MPVLEAIPEAKSAISVKSSLERHTKDGAVKAGEYRGKFVHFNGGKERGEKDANLG